MHEDNKNYNIEEDKEDMNKINQTVINSNNQESSREIFLGVPQGEGDNEHIDIEELLDGGEENSSHEDSQARDPENHKEDSREKYSEGTYNLTFRGNDENNQNNGQIINQNKNEIESRREVDNANKGQASFYTAAFLIHQILIVLCLIVISSNPIIKIVVFISIQMIYIVWIAISRPFINNFDNIHKILNEIYIILYLSIMLLLHFCDEEMQIWLSVIFLIVISILSGICPVVQFVKWAKSKCQSPPTKTIVISTELAVIDVDEPNNNIDSDSGSESESKYSFG